MILSTTRNVKWSEKLKRRLNLHQSLNFAAMSFAGRCIVPLRTAALYYDTALVDRPSLFDRVFPTAIGFRTRTVSSW